MYFTVASKLATIACMESVLWIVGHGKPLLFACHVAHNCVKFAGQLVTPGLV